MRQNPGHRMPAEKVTEDIRRETRRQSSAEDRICIVLEGLRGEASIATLYRHDETSESL